MVTDLEGNICYQDVTSIYETYVFRHKTSQLNDMILKCVMLDILSLIIVRAGFYYNFWLLLSPLDEK